jgi:hypothetical protein
MEVPILVCSPLVRNTLMWPSLRRTHSFGNNPPLQQKQLHPR